MTPGTVAGKVMAILGAFAAGDGRLRLTEVCRRADLAPATGHRLMAELVAGGFLERLDDGSYRVGVKLWHIGTQAHAATDLRDLALPHMEDLYEATHENVQLAVLRDGKALYLERLRGTRSMPIVTRVGTELPLHATGVGKVLLAYAPGQLRERALSEPLAAHTSRTITDPDRLRECLTEVRRTGVATTSGEMTVGAHSVAAPVRDRHDTVVAALSLVTGRRTADLRRLIPTVTTAARALSRDVAQHWSGSADIGGDADWGTGGRADGDSHPRG
ncbi:IclR family transcriptional regulator [Embleya sp. NPDC005971]|uniref:IclR family transcriptional regulator n=1 Tax=unclassified Embleya TaxID=2699296 RepID=UPI003411D7FA